MGGALELIQSLNNPKIIDAHKQIAQTNCTKQDDITSKNGNNKRRFGVLQSNSGAYGVPETG